jgi:hypothetical protein
MAPTTELEGAALQGVMGATRQGVLPQPARAPYQLAAKPLECVGRKSKGILSADSRLGLRSSESSTTQIGKCSAGVGDPVQPVTAHSGHQDLLLALQYA